jgi:hypothetical protein
MGLVQSKRQERQWRKNPTPVSTPDNPRRLPDVFVPDEGLDE